METLQNAYRDDDDDYASDDMILSPNPNLISDPTDPNQPTTVPHAEHQPGPGAEPMVMEFTATSASRAEQEDRTKALGSEAEKAEALGLEVAGTLDSKPSVVAEARSSEVSGMAEALGSDIGMAETLGSEAGVMAETLGLKAATVAETLGLEAAGMVSEEETLGSERFRKVEGLVVEEISSDSISESEHKNGNSNVSEVPECSEVKKSEGEDIEEEEDDDDETTMETLALKKQKSLTLDHLDAAINGNASKKPSKKKSKNNSVWTKPTSRKGKKKAKNGGNNINNNNSNQSPPKTENAVLVTPMPRFPDKNDDNPESKICLSKVSKAEKVELSEDRLSAGSCKGYRMVRATRGVSEGAWYFEIKVVHLGDSGHTRLGWSNERGDLQAPVGYDGNSFGYRDIDGCKIHKALREKYGEEGYKQGDVIGFYINLPEGESYAPKGPHLVLYKGQKYVCASNSKEDPPKCVPGSEISFFKNGVCQGVAFKDLYGGRYYPAASMYTLPNQPNCVVKFNFGPDFECFPTEFEGRPVPRPMIEVPYHGYEDRVENGVLDENKQ